jgi:hypothetical protein
MRDKTKLCNNKQQNETKKMSNDCENVVQNVFVDFGWR